MKRGESGLPPLWALLPLGLYLWLIWACPRSAPASGLASDDYNLLARGMLEGHLYLATPVPDALLRLPNPYDPAQRPPGVALHDASLYHGHYYIYFGVTPLCLLVLPYVALTHHDLPLGAAVWLFGSGTYLISLALLGFLRRRHYPEAPRLVLGVAALGLAFGGAELTLMVRHSMYELPIACGACLFLGALYCLLRGLDAPRPERWAAAGGLLLGLAAGCRPFYALGYALFLAPLAFSRARRAGRLTYGKRAAAAAALPWACAGCCLAAYNAARFGSPLEFGQRYQLSGNIEGQVQHFALRYVPFNAYVYLLSPLRWGRYFPFVHNIAVPSLPRGFGGWEWSYGLLPNLPFSFFAAVGAAAAVIPRPRAGEDDALLRLRLALVGAGGGAILVLMCGFFGSVARYEGDFGPPLMLLAAGGLLEAHRRVRGRAGRRWIVAAGAGSAAFTAFAALMAAFILYGIFALESPRAFAFLASAFNAPVAAAERWAGLRYGPIELSLSLPAELGRREPLLRIGWPQAEDGLWLERLDDGHVRFSVSHGSPAAVDESPPIALAPSAPHRIALSLPALYPPDAHPFFAGRSAGERSSLKRWAWVSCDGVPVWRTPADGFEPAPGTLQIGGEGFTGRIAAQRRLPPPWSEDPLPPTRFRIAFRLEPARPGQAFPLFSSGHTRAGDTLVLDLEPGGRGHLAYDHWGLPARRSPSFALAAGTLQVLAVRLESADRPSRVHVTVARDGRVLWDEILPRFSAPPYAFFPAENRIGASTCERAFPGASVTAETPR